MTELILGSKAINFSLRGIDNKIYTLDDFKDTKYIAIMFTCNHCPYVIASEREFVALQKEFSDIFTFIAINSNVGNENYPTDSYKNMIIRAKERGFKFPYLADDGQKVSKIYTAGRTPEIFLYDENRELIYTGRINDNPKFLDKIKRNDLREALLELKDGKNIGVPQTQPLGCSIKWIK